MNFPKPLKFKSGPTTYNYVQFGDVLAFNSFTDSQMKKLSIGNNVIYEELVHRTRERIESGSDWYGTPVPTGIMELDGHKKYLGMHLIGEVQSRIKEHLEKYMNYLDSETLPKRRLSYNDRGLGVFSFDRAGMSLFKMNKVNLTKPIDQVISKLGIELNRTALQTRIKNVYAFFENKHASYPSMRLYLLAGANAYVKGNNLLYVGLACAEVAEFLEMRNVAVEVNVMIGSEFKGQTSFAVVRIKRFEERLDKNQLLLMSSDPRYFRYRGFKALIALANYFDLTIPETLGKVTAEMGSDFVEAQADDGFVFGQSYSLDSVCKEVVRIIENYVERLKNGKKAK